MIRSRRRAFGSDSVGDPRIDRRVVIQALGPDAKRVFTEPFRAALLELLDRSNRPALTVAGGLARLDWDETQRPNTCIRAAAELLVCLRELPPVPMLRKPRKRA